MIEVKKLYKSYGDKEFPVLKNIEMKAEKGSIHGLIGHNGSGKTTLIKCLAGIFKPDQGEVLVGGSQVYENPSVKENIGYVADSNHYFPSYKVKEMVRFYGQVFPKFSEGKFNELNEIFQVNPRSQIRHLSKGQQMRVSFMLNIAIRPTVLLLDEPTSGLDAIAKRQLLDLLVTEVEEEGTAVVISSHHLSELEKVCDYVTMLKNGEVDMQGDLEMLKEQVEKYQVVFPEGAPPEFYNMENLLYISNVGSIYTVLCRQNKSNMKDKMKEMGALLTEPISINLEEAFVWLNEGGMDDVKQTDL